MCSPGVKNHEPELEAEKGDDSGTGPGNADGEMCNLVDVYLALTSDNPNMARKTKSVTINEDITTSHDVIAYSEVYGRLPYTLFATASGWKTVGPRANPYTGKSSEVMTARLAARAKHHDRDHINLYRNVMVRTVNGKLDNCSTLLDASSVSHFIHNEKIRISSCRGSMSAAKAASLMSELPDFELSASVDSIAVVKGKAANKFKQRLGSKKVKQSERDAAMAD